ncbi:hypothetical protein O7746_03020 [Corynebacterium pseudotuberculosis]|uniref:hypothetical protein n=1 Tax=Corynebacterium pseudotuberculosis TaxID=1719 RepID=UPI00090C71A7|nr:hypothetical protein [Corynebacterium pseudotuberculosis]APG81059.1 hypothetical protein CPI37_0367 [Corynebacterium pseudotuberculosis]WFP67532.1 hypothetical protein P8128_01815 [Corynebacterium pseudotuberculosis]
MAEEVCASTYALSTRGMILEPTVEFFVLRERTPVTLDLSRGLVGVNRLCS